MKSTKKKPAAKRVAKKPKAPPKSKVPKNAVKKEFYEEIQDFRIDELKIENFKAFDSLNIKFPKPRMAGDLDVTVIGSRNGLGKTSILEACAFLFIGTGDVRGEIERWLIAHIIYPLDMVDLLIHGGKNVFRLAGRFYSENLGEERNTSITLNTKKEIRHEGQRLLRFERNSLKDIAYAQNHFMNLLAGMTSDPLTMPGLLYFHSYRKVQEGNPDLGGMINSDFPSKLVPSRHLLKMAILRSMMGQADLFENIKDSDMDDSLEIFDELLRRYAGGTIGKLRPSYDNTMEIRITPENGEPSFTFDGLSSGQKEIISTLFLIWKYTKDQPSIVLIDEPELHLNAEWHGDFIMQLEKIAPQNQYIIATHSKDVFSSVPAEQRLLLEGGGK